MDNEIKRIILKFLILKIIGDKPTHGYEIIQEIERRSNGRWTPSTGSIYPALDTLEARGWITSADSDRRKVYSITPEGKVALEQMIKKWREQLREMALFLNTIMEDEDGSAEPAALPEEMRLNERDNRHS